MSTMSTPTDEKVDTSVEIIGEISNSILESTQKNDDHDKKAIDSSKIDDNLNELVRSEVVPLAGNSTVNTTTAKNEADETTLFISATQNAPEKAMSNADVAKEGKVKKSKSSEESGVDSTGEANTTKIKTSTSTTISKMSSKDKAQPSLGTKNPAVAPAAQSSTSTSTSTTTTTSRKKKQEKGKKQGKKRKAMDASGSNAPTRRGSNDFDDSTGSKKPGPKKGKKKKKSSDNTDSITRKTKDQDATTTGKVKKTKKGKLNSNKYSPAQAAVKDMMRQLLEEDKYSQKGSIVETESSDDEDDERTIFAIASGTASTSKRGTYGADATISMLRLDRATITRAMRKRMRIEEMRGVMDTSGTIKKRANSVVLMEDHNDLIVTMDDDGKFDSDSVGRGEQKKKRKKAKRNVRSGKNENGICIKIGAGYNDSEDFGFENGEEDGIYDEDDPRFEESSIFGQTTGSNSTWVECDKCGKWRRLRGLVDTKKLPTKWYCSMNKNDTERSSCSAPEEEYEAQNTPENATDQRTRKHLRLWVRRLQCNEKYESILPTMTRGKRRNHVTSSSEPYEWVRCCNPSCGKWRALLKSMDASSVIEAANDGKWYCVLNTWDEKTASCAAPQESLPALGCPPWVKKLNV